MVVVEVAVVVVLVVVVVVVEVLAVAGWDILLGRAKLSPVTRSSLYCFRPITDSPNSPSINIFILSQVITVVPRTIWRQEHRRQYFSGILFFEGDQEGSPH